MLGYFRSKNKSTPPRSDVDPTTKATEASETVKSTSTETTEKRGLFKRFSEALKRTRQRLSDGFEKLIFGKKTIDADLFQGLEAVLLSADVGVETTRFLLEQLTQKVSRKELSDPQALLVELKNQMLALLKPVEQPLTITAPLFVLLMVGINGAGKTTTIAKLAHYYRAMGKKVMLAAGDTFRAAAVEQLQIWGERNHVPVIAQQTGADSASVIYDAMQAATARHYDLLIADTAGRLHTQSHLMEELKKVKRVMTKINPAAPQETILVLDAGTGQNALQQAQQFREAIGVSGIILTKLDGTAKGGSIFAIAKQVGLPIRFIGVGESIDDLRPFEAQAFVDALFGQES